MKKSTHPVVLAVQLVFGGMGGIAVAIVLLQILGVDLIPRGKPASSHIAPAGKVVAAASQQQQQPQPPPQVKESPPLPIDPPPEQPPQNPPESPTEFLITSAEPTPEVPAVASVPTESATAPVDPAPKVPAIAATKPAGPFFAAGQSWAGLWVGVTPIGPADFSVGIVRLELGDVSESALTGKVSYVWRTVGQTGRGEYAVNGTRRGNMLQWAGDVESKVAGVLKDDTIVWTAQYKNHADEIWLIPAPLAIAPETVAGEYRVKDDRNSFLATIKADGTATRKTMPPASGVWQGTDKTIVVAWLDGWRDVWQIEESDADGKVNEAKRSEYRFGQSIGGKGAAGGRVERVQSSQ